MPRLTVFNQVSVDGYIADLHGDMSWAHKDDPEWNAFVAGNAQSGGRLLFGRITYELMTRYWPTPGAMENAPVVAGQMNVLPKIVFSRTLAEATWNNTRLVKTDLIGEVRRLKKEPGEDTVILGSGSIVSQLAPEGLIDTYLMVVNPPALGAGKTMFEGIPAALALKLTGSRAFRNGNVLLSYEPAG